MLHLVQLDLYDIKLCEVCDHEQAQSLVVRIEHHLDKYRLIVHWIHE